MIGENKDLLCHLPMLRYQSDRRISSTVCRTVKPNREILSYVHKITCSTEHEPAHLEIHFHTAEPRHEHTRSFLYPAPSCQEMADW